MNYDFDRLVDRTASDSVKWGARKSLFKNEEAIPMWVADMDFPAPQEVIEALKSRVEHGVYGYGMIPQEYYETVRNWLQKRHGWNVEADWILHVPGVLAGVSFALNIVTQPGDKVLIQPPVYHPFRHLVENLQRTVVNSPLKSENGHYEMDYEGLEAQLQKGVKAAILCSPHNPIGRVWTADELRRYAELCEKYDVFVIADEIHSDLILPGHRHTPYATVSKNAAQHSVTLIAPSKTFNLAGFHAATAIAPDDAFRDALKQGLQQFHVGNPDILAKVALQTAYEKGEDWLELLLNYIADNVRFIQGFVTEHLPEIQVTPIEGTYLLWLDFRSMNLDQEALQEFMIHEAGIALNEGSMFGEEGTGFMRMNVACPRETVERAMRQLETAMIGFRSRQ